MAKDVGHEELIQLVHDRPAIWDKRSREYSDRDLCNKKWEEVFEAVTPNWQSLSSKHRIKRGNKIVTRWRSLRDRYRRDLNEEANARSGAGSSKYKKGTFFEMLDFLRNVMSLRSTASNISNTDEDTDIEGTQQEGEMEDEERHPTPLEDPPAAARGMPPRQLGPVRSISTTSRGKKTKKKNVDDAMLNFMEEMRVMRRPDNDPFADPTNEDACFLRSQFHQLQKIPPNSKIDAHVAIASFIGLCVKASISGDPLPPVIPPPQRPFHQEHAQPTSFSGQHYHPAIVHHHQRAPPTTAQNFGPPPQTPTYDSTSSQATAYASSSQPYSSSPSPYYTNL